MGENTSPGKTEREKTMTSTATAILGIPVDNLSMDSAVSGILEMIDLFKVDKRPRYVATINVDFITNILSWRKGRSRHPELMYILRKADMVTADGMPIVWASRWLGSPLAMRVPGSDLVPLLAKAAASKGKSLYFLGGKRFEMTAFRAAHALQKKLPELNVAGVDAPWVHTGGEALAQAEEEDDQIVGRINAARPDILLIALGSPKQEIWFDRNRHRLKVPVVIGVGATFDFLAGTTPRAPKWMQQSGFEWLFRLYQEPRRLWKRYLIDFLKFSLRIWPSVLYYRLEAAKNIIHKRISDHHPNPDPITKTDDQVTVSLPSHLKSEAVIDSVTTFQSAAKITFDFSAVKRIDAGGIGTLAKVWQQAEADGRIMSLSGLTPQHKKYLSVNCLTDFFVEIRRPSFSYTKEHLSDDIVLLELSGILDTRQKTTLNYLKFLEDIGQKDCIFDMSNLSYIGSSGLMLILNISKYILSAGNCFVVCSPCRDVKQMFRMTDLKRLFIILPDKTAAQAFIHEVRGDIMP